MATLEVVPSEYKFRNRRNLRVRNGLNTSKDSFARPRGPQKFAWTEIPLAEIKAIKSASGTHVNDVILALVTATIRRYVEGHGDPVKRRLFRMMTPVNLRGNDSAGGLSNCISLVPVTIPLDTRDSAKLLAAVLNSLLFAQRGDA
jgi:diacylglycerol O-acyltransferase / wax synthase